MKRLVTILGVLCVCISIVSPVTAVAMERYVKGVHYKVVAPGPARTPTPHVQSFFSYACPHCYHLEPKVDEWRATLADNVVFERVPAQWNAHFKEMAKLYYALEDLKLADQHSMAIFDEIHKKKRGLHTEGNVLAFIQSLGLDKQRFQRILSSEGVEKQMRKGRGILAQYKIPGVPSFVVNGRYFVNVSLAGSPEQLFEVMNYLLTR